MIVHIQCQLVAERLCSTSTATFYVSVRLAENPERSVGYSNQGVAAFINSLHFAVNISY